MPTFKNIRIKKRGGGTRMQRVRVLSSGKFRFVKNLGKSRTSRTKRRSNPPTRRKGVRRMTRRKRRGGGGKSITRQAFKWLRIGALVAPAVSRAMDPGIANKEKVERIIQDYTGYNINDKEFRWEYLARGWSAYIASVAVTYGVPKLGAILRRL